MEIIIFTVSFKKKQPTIWVLLDFLLMRTMLFRQLLTDCQLLFNHRTSLPALSHNPVHVAAQKSHEFTETECSAILEHSKTVQPTIFSTVGFFFIFAWEPASFFLKTVLLTLRIIFKSPCAYHIFVPCQSD